MIVPQLLTKGHKSLRRRVLWFAASHLSSEHNFYGNISFTIKWETVQQKLGPKLYLIDQEIYNGRSFTRVLFTTKNYNKILKKVDLALHGSPLMKNESGFHLHASHCMNKVRWGPHELQIAIEVTDADARWLFLNCKPVANNHDKANVSSGKKHTRRDGKEYLYQPHLCYKFNSAQNLECPYQWTPYECERYLRAILDLPVRDSRSKLSLEMSSVTANKNCNRMRPVSAEKPLKTPPNPVARVPSSPHQCAISVSPHSAKIETPPNSFSTSVAPISASVKSSPREVSSHTGTSMPSQQKFPVPTVRFPTSPNSSATYASSHPAQVETLLPSFSTSAAPISAPVQSSKRTLSSHTRTSALPTVQPSVAKSPRTLPTPAVKSERSHSARVKIPSKNYSTRLATSPNILSTFAIPSQRPAPKPGVKNGWKSCILPAVYILPAALTVFLAIRIYFRQSSRASFTRIGNSRIEFFSNALHYNYARGISGFSGIFHRLGNRVDAQNYWAIFWFAQ
ncbi:uncharacterized protein LOC108665555 [Hyalella azteca]|uniref:Uncharacterized protein LOC108665555 n=1 Tax=Hyalella azteca TaxID=294128 RepID=A0A8B7N308_HYAAZ|nr:uncharacterized protein LOC108665555 [Hyalella azteca]XP_047737152.1 uncharacterized protein LOC108665555 [Hyalella azteca]